MLPTCKTCSKCNLPGRTMEPDVYSSYRSLNPSFVYTVTMGLHSCLSWKSVSKTHIFTIVPRGCLEPCEVFEGPHGTLSTWRNEEGMKVSNGRINKSCLCRPWHQQAVTTNPEDNEGKDKALPSIRWKSAPVCLHDGGNLLQEQHTLSEPFLLHRSLPSARNGSLWTPHFWSWMLVQFLNNNMSGTWFDFGWKQCLNARFPIIWS